MPKQVKILSIALLFGVLSLRADLIPSSSCSYFDSSNIDLGFQCSLYGDASNAVVTAQFPAGWNAGGPSTIVTGGYVVIEDPTANPATNNIVADSNNFYGSSDSNEADWTQILYFAPVNPSLPVGTSAASEATLYTVGCNDSLNPADTSCFPDYATMMADAYFDVYTSPDTYVLNEGQSTNHIYTVNLVTVAPEPATLGFACGGLALLAVLRRRLRSKASAQH